MIQILDFNDSFTYNIANILDQFGLKTEIISYEKIEIFLLNCSLEKFERKVIVYGPGPGHPSQYFKIYQNAKRLINQKNIFHFGICLGHQILWSLLGKEVIESSNKLHGQSIKVKVPNWKDQFSQISIGKNINVMRYNSLVVDLGIPKHGERFCLVDDEVMIAAKENLISYQFHPESIGTSYPELFFYPIINFLYNNKDEKQFENRWHL